MSMGVRATHPSWYGDWGKQEIRFSRQVHMRVRLSSLPHVVIGLVATLAISASAAAQPTYTVKDLGPAPDPSTPTSAVLLSNGSGQVVMRQPFAGPGARNAFFWEPGLPAPVLAGARVDDTQNVFAISSNGFVAGLNDGGFATPYRWSRSGRYEALAGVDTYYPLAVNASGVVVGTQLFGTFRAVVWYAPRPAAATYIDDLSIEGRDGWNTFNQALSISDDGIITGIGRFVTSTGAIVPRYFALIPSGGALDRSDWTASATEFSPNDPPANAIDGNINTRFSTGQAQHDSQGFAVSWPGDRTIGRIRFEVGPNIGDYPRTCGIWVTDSAANVTFVPCQVDGSGNVDVSFSPIPAQKIEVWQWGTAAQWWSIAEFNAFKP
jgi:hypothetical protein